MLYILMSILMLIICIVCAVFCIICHRRMKNVQIDAFFQIQSIEQEYLYRKMQSLCRIASMFAHEMNNKMNSIIGYSELIQRKTETDPVLIKYIDGVLSSARSGVEICDRLMSFARRGKNLNIKADMHLLIDEKVAHFRLAQNANGIRLDCCCKAENAIVKGDPQLLGIMINSVIENAVDAMPDGGVVTICTDTVTVNNRVVSDRKESVRVSDGKYLELKISDTGSGISSDNKEYLFEPFFTTKKDKMHSGFGLSTAWSCAQCHNGFISLQGADGEGSSCTIFLPLGPN